MAAQRAFAGKASQRSVAELIVAQLGLWGVRQIFGVPGRSVLGLLDAVRRQDGVRYVETRQEEAAALMASAYAKLTGHLSVCLGSAGPGVTNLLTGVEDAQSDCVPVLALCGRVGLDSVGRGAYQALDQHAIFETCCHFNYELNHADNAAETLMLACKAAIEKRGASRLGIPSNLAPQAVLASPIGPEGHLVSEHWAAPPERIAETVKMLAGAQRPVILAGWGARHSRDMIARCAELFDAPVATTCRVKGLLPDDDPLALGVVGRFGSSVATEAVRDADVLLVVGSSLSENTTDGWTLISHNTRIAQIDLSPGRIGRNNPVTVPMVADAYLTLDEIIRQATPVHRHHYRKHLEARKQDWLARVDQKAESNASPILPQRAIRELANVCADDAIIALDVGDHAVFFCQQFAMRNQTVVTSGHLGVMGFSLPAANAGQLAYPNRQVIALCGDGGFSAIMGEFLTAVQYKLPITVVVMSNGEYGMTRGEELHDQLTPAGFYTGLADCDFASFARACGGHGVRVSKPEDLHHALAQALRTRAPALVQIDVSPDERPLFQA